MKTLDLLKVVGVCVFIFLVVGVIEGPVTAETLIPSISGFVFDENNDPIFNAEICADGYYGDNNPPHYGCVSSNSDGIYVFYDLPDGDFLLRASKPGYTTELFDNIYLFEYSTPVNVSEGSETLNIDFVLSPGGTISGTVFEGEGNTRISNIGVFLVSLNYTYHHTVCTNDDGVFNFTDVPFDMTVWVFAPATWFDCGGPAYEFADQWWPQAQTQAFGDMITLTTAVPDITGVDFSLDPQVPLPDAIIRASLMEDWVNLWHFTPEDEVFISIKEDANGPLLVDMERHVADENGGIFIEYWEQAGHVDIRPGMLITAMDNWTGVQRSLEVAEVTLDSEFNRETGNVFGTGPADSLIDVWLFPCCGSAQTISNSDGVWYVNLGPFPDHQKPAAMVYDQDGDVTEITAIPEWLLPYIQIQPSHDWIIGHNWPEGQEVNLKIATDENFVNVIYPEPPNPPITQMPGSLPPSPAGGNLFFNLKDTFDVSPGQFIRLSNGTTERTIKVADLSMEIDYENNVATGGGAEDGSVYVCVLTASLTGPGICVHDYLAVGNTWTVNYFDHDFTLVPDMIGYVEVYEPDGDKTALFLEDYSSITAVTGMDYNRIIIEGWTPDTEVAVSVYEYSGGPLLVEPLIKLSDTEGYFILDEADLNNIDLLPDQFIYVSDGEKTKQHIISALSIDNIDPVAKKITGTGDIEEWLLVDLWETDWSVGEPDISKETQVLSEGEWVIDLSGDEFILTGNSAIKIKTSEPDMDSTAVWYSLIDSDGDGIIDTSDNAPNDYNPDQADGDGDGVGDVADNAPNDYNPDQADDDGDGVGDVADNAPNDYNPDQADGDGDGVGDVADNAPDDYNPDQSDLDGDGVGDVNDPCPANIENTCNPDNSAAANIGPEGGTLVTPNGAVTMTIPPGALSDDTTLSITDIGAGFGLGTDLGSAFSVFGVEIGPSGTVFAIPVTIEFSWEDTDNDGIVDNTAIIEDELFVSKDGVAYTPPCSIYVYCDTDNNTISFFTYSLSEWVLAVIDSTTLGPITAPVDPTLIHSPVTVGADYVSNFASQAFTATWDWGDGSTSQGFVASGQILGDHVYESAGVYSITLELVNNLIGDTLTATYQYIVVYDPDGGFVTGGGWIDSPAGAYLPDPTLAGKATFGFVSKYKKGASVPTGNTEFQFKVAGLNFHSSSYDWLVVTGDDFARFKGTGTINGLGEYKFMIWAGDGDPDTFRIKIWEEDEAGTETVIYDNGFEQSLGGGSIVVHTGK